MIVRILNIQFHYTQNTTERKGVLQKENWQKRKGTACCCTFSGSMD